MIKILETPLIYLITKGEATEENFTEKSREILDIVGLAVDKKINLIQLREKRLTAKSMFQLAVHAVKLTTGSSTRLLINDRADIAMAARADGVHLTESSVHAGVIRRSFPAHFCIGVSTHSVDAVKLSSRRGADFAVFGPVFNSPGKGEPRGITALAEACAAVPEFPVIGLGGINQDNFEYVLSAGARGFAAIRWLNEPEALQSLQI